MKSESLARAAWLYYAGCPNIFSSFTYFFDLKFPLLFHEGLMLQRNPHKAISNEIENKLGALGN